MSSFGRVDKSTGYTRVRVREKINRIKYSKRIGKKKILNEIINE